jgi:hypothetical protein
MNLRTIEGNRGKPIQISQIYEAFAHHPMAGTLRVAENHLRELVAGIRTTGEAIPVLSDPKSMAFLTEQWVEIGGLTPMAAIRRVIELERDMNNPLRDGRSGKRWKRNPVKISRYRVSRPTTQTGEYFPKKDKGIKVSSQREKAKETTAAVKSTQKTRIKKEAKPARTMRRYLEDTPIVDPKSGVFTDSTGEWATRRYFYDTYGIRHETLVKAFADVPSRPGRGKGGALTFLFHRELGLQALGMPVEVPRVDRTTGLYIDEEGTIWISINRMHQETGLAARTLKKLAVRLESQSIRTGNGSIRPFHKASELRERISNYDKYGVGPSPNIAEKLL